MRTGTKKCILLLLAIIVLCFAVWLLWPHSFVEVTGIPAEYPDLNMAAIVTATRFENGCPALLLPPRSKTVSLRSTPGSCRTAWPGARNMKPSCLCCRKAPTGRTRGIFCRENALPSAAERAMTAGLFC